MKKKIIIIGSGIAGLTLANFLKNNSNYEFIIYEKRDTFILNEGYGIQLSINSVSILNQLGFNKFNLIDKYHPINIDFYKINFKKICDLNISSFNEKENKYTSLKRSKLINFLYNNVPSKSIRFGKKVVNIEKANNRIKIKFNDGSNDIADYLVVSDGTFSNTRSIINKEEIIPSYYGSIAIRTSLRSEKIYEIDSRNISLIMGSNTHIVLYPVNQKKEINIICIIRQKLIAEEPPINILKKTIFKENINLSRLFKGELKSWPIYTSKKIFKSDNKNIFFIGDAFYTFPPTMAQGASQSIESANEIFKLLEKKENNVQEEYFTYRKKRTNQIKIRSSINYFIFHISNPILKALRNLILKIAIKNKLFNKFYLGNIFRK